MAGGILIALLVIGALVLMFSNLQDYQIKTNASNQQTEVANFNNQFEPYNKNNLTLMELKSVYNKIISNNSKYPEYYIDTNIYPNVYDKIKKSFSQIEESDKITKVFEDNIQKIKTELLKFIIDNNNSENKERFSNIIKL